MQVDAPLSYGRPDPDVRAMPLRFADCELDPVTRELRRGGFRVPVQPKAFAVLLYLVRNRDRLVPREELLRELWPGVAVTPASVSRAVKSARRAVGDDGRAQRVLETAKAGGVRFVALVSGTDEDGDAHRELGRHAREQLAIALERWKEGTEGAREPAREALVAARAAGLRRVHAEAALAWAGYFDHHREPDPEILSVLEDALLLLQADDHDLRARLLARLAAEESFCADGSRRDAALYEAIGIARALGDVSLETEIFVMPFLATAERLGAEQLRSLVERALATAARTDDPLLRRRGLHLRVRHLLRSGAPLTDLDAALAEAEREASVSGDPYLGYVTALDRATHALLAGDPDRAEALSRAAAAGAKRSHVDTAPLFLLLSQLLMIEVARGRAGETVALMAADAARRPGPSSRCILAWLQAESGDPDAARTTLDEVVARDLATLPRYVSFTANAAVLARACFLTRFRDPAPALERILAPIRSQIVIRGLIGAHGPGARYLALLAALRGERAHARGLLAEARAIADRAGVASWCAEIEKDATEI